MEMNISEIISTLLYECRRRRNLVLILFVMVSMSLLAVGWVWPKEYSSHATILVDESNIIQPLMEGTAVATAVTDRARIAREVIFSRRSMDALLESEHWEIEGLTPVQIERTIDEIKKKIAVSNQGRNIIRIQFTDKSPELAFFATDKLTTLFITESVEAKRRESQNAFDFIDQQAKEYHAKLLGAESELEAFRSENLGANPENLSTVNARILELQRRIEQTRLEIREMGIAKQALEAQLSGEAEVSANLTREDQYQERIAQLQGQLDELRLTYHDTYPDIVILRDQIAKLQEALKNSNNEDNFISDQARLSPLYQELRSSLSQTTTQIASLQARLEETEVLLEEERRHAIQINQVEAQLAEMTRDYDVNQDIYQDLLRQRERARVSMNIDLANQGLTMKIQEHAALPVRPTGLRFLHFAAAGLLLGLMTPISLVYGLSMIDGRVRSERALEQLLNMPVLANIHHYPNARERTREIIWWIFCLVVLASVAGAYGFAALMKIQ